MPDWDDIPKLRDELVEAHFAGDTARVMTLGQLIIDTGLSESSELVIGDERATGTLLRPDQIPGHIDHLDLLDGHVSAERLDGLYDGEDLAADELALAQDLWVRSVFKENPDCDIYGIWALCETKHGRDGRTMWTVQLGTGYSLTQVDIRFVGAFATRELAVAALHWIGYVNEDDYRQRCPGARRS